MERVQGAIQALGQPLQRQLRAQVQVSNAAEAVAELVANSLDAGAQEVAVELELRPAGLGFAVRDDGAGMRAADLALLGQRHATSKRPAAAAPAAPALLGYRGEALAALCQAAEEVEVTSRAAGSFETHACVLRGGRAARRGLAMEQRKRQGMAVAVRGLFAGQPVRCKALMSAGLQQEADRCREAVLRLALLRPGVGFTVFDRARQAFTLRMPRGRDEARCVADFLGQPRHQLATLAPLPGARHAISGYAALPPHGHPSAARQCVYVNGRWVKAAPVAKLIDRTFDSLYKANMRLQEAQGEELRQVHKAANKRAAFVLHISCRPGEYELAHEADGALVQWQDWEPLLASVKHALLAAWRPALNNSLLRELEALEGGGGGLEEEGGGRGGAAAAGGADRASSQAAGREERQAGGSTFHQWLLEQQAGLEAPLSGSQGRSSGQQQQPGAAQAEAQQSERAKPPARTSGRHRGSGRLQPGGMQALASRLVRYNAAAAGPAQVLPAKRSMPDPENGPTGRAAERSTFWPTEGQHQLGRQQGMPAAGQEFGQRSPGMLRGQPFQQQPESIGPAWQPDDDAPWPPGGGGAFREMDAAPGPWHGAQAGLGLPGCQLSSGDDEVHLLRSWAPVEEGRDGQQWLGREQPGQQWGVADMEWQEEEAEGGFFSGLQPGGWSGGSDLERQGSGWAAEQVPPSLAGITGQADRFPWELRDSPPRRSSPAAVAPWEQRRSGQRSQHQLVRGRQQAQQAGLTAEERELLHRTSLVPAYQAGQPRRAQSAPPHPRPPQRGVHARGRRPAEAWEAAMPAKPAVAARESAIGGSTAGRQPLQQQVEEGPGSGQPGTAAGSCSGPAQQQVPSWGGRAFQTGAGENVPVEAGPRSGPGAFLSSWRQPGTGLAGAGRGRGGGGARPRLAGPGASSEVEVTGILSLETVAGAAFARLAPAALSREQLGGGRALQQVDAKFVPVLCGSLLALVDQHAADERVQLERLRDQLLRTDGRPRQAHSHALRAPLPLGLTSSEEQLLEGYGPRVAAWGWRWRSDPAAGTVLTHEPLLWGTGLTATDLKLYLHHLADTCGAGGLPAGVVRVLNSKACRGAIMFGDELGQGQCQALLDSLKATQMCFSCAHGRPTTVPLVDLRLLRRALHLRRQQLASIGSSIDCGAAGAGGREGRPTGLAGLEAKLGRDLMRA